MMQLDGEADDGCPVGVHRAEGIAVGEGDVLDEAADDSAAVRLCIRSRLVTPVAVDFSLRNS